MCYGLRMLRSRLRIRNSLHKPEVEMHKRHIVRIFFSVIMVFCLRGQGGAAPESGAFAATVSPIHVDGVVNCVVSEDLDGDGVGELAVGYTELSGAGKPRKSVAVFNARGKSSYGPAPGMVIPLPADVGTIDFGDVSGDGRPDLVVSRPGTLEAFLLKGDGTFATTPVPVLKGAFILPHSRTGLFSFCLFRDMDNDGRPDLLLPTLNGYDLYSPNEHGIYPAKPSQSFQLGYGTRESEDLDRYFLGVEHRIPLPTRLDINGDGRLDVAFADGSSVTFFTFDPQTGSYGAARTVELPVRHEAIQYVVSEVNDFDVDGNPDIVVHRVFSRKVSLDIDSLFFRGKPGLTFGSKEDFKLSGEREIILPRFMDLEDAGARDFVTFSQRLSLNAIMDYFIRNRVTVDVAIHPNRKGEFSKSPDVVRKVSLKLDEDEGRPAAASGDFNGDGKDDLIYTPNAGTLNYMLATGKERIPDSPTLSRDVPSFGKLVVEDVNRDGKDDVVILYEIEKRKGDLSLLVSDSGPEETIP